MMHTNSIRAIILLFCFLSVITGCGKNKPYANGVSIPPQQSTAPAPLPSAAPSPAEKPMQIQAYYADKAGNKLVKKQVTIRYQTDSAKYMSTLNALKTSPDDQSVPLWDGFGFLSAENKAGNLVINVSLKKEGQLGSGAEALLLESLERTLFQFPELKTIDVLLEGKPVDSLMGHMDLPHPMSRSDF